MTNLPQYHVYSLVVSELEQAFKYVYDIEPDKASIEQKQQFISVLESYIDSIDKDNIRNKKAPIIDTQLIDKLDDRLNQAYSDAVNDAQNYWNPRVAQDALQAAYNNVSCWIDEILNDEEEAQK